MTTPRQRGPPHFLEVTMPWHNWKERLILYIGLALLFFLIFMGSAAILLG